MDNERQETIADIVSEIRAQNLGLPEDSYALSPLVCDLLSLARRIEVANAREREVGAEAAQICGEIGEMIGREATSENSSQVGNVAKMREAPEEQMERIVRDAILSYEQLYKDAPNDDSEREIIERCAIANGWLVSNGFARQAVSFDKEESPNL